MHFFQTSLKLNKKEQKFVMETIEHFPKCQQFSKCNMEELFADEEKKLEFGYYLRQALHHWPSVVIFAMANELSENSKQESKETPKDVQNRYQAMNDSIRENNYHELHTMKEAIDGKALCAAYEVKVGAIVQPLKQEMLLYQLKNPCAAKEEVLEYMMAQKESFIGKYSK